MVELFLPNSEALMPAPDKHLDEYLLEIGQKAVAWEQALESGDRNKMLEMRSDFNDFRAQLPPQLPFKTKQMIEEYDNLLPRLPQLRP